MKHFFFLSAILIMPIHALAQSVLSIPENRRTDWESAGYEHSATSELPVSENYRIITVAPPTGNAESDYKRIIHAVETASTLSSAGNYVVIKLAAGTYIIEKTLELGLNNSFIIISGSGIDKTYLKKSSESNSSAIIGIKGQTTGDFFYINSYDKNTNSIRLASAAPQLQPGDFIDIQVPNGSWFNSPNSPEHDLLGQVVKIQSKINAAEFVLEDDFSFVWNLAASENKTPYFKKVDLVHHIGFENFSAEPLNGNEGTLFTLDYTRDIWFRNVETYNAVNAHYQVSHSTQIEFRNNYVHHAQNYGVGGHGYGVELIRRTTNSLVEDNIFQSLRHSMLIARGASRNVFGYNYSREQISIVNNRLSDLSLHGNFPFLNLFEGNHVDRIEADNYHGSNGFYNTFIRNYTHFNTLKVVNSDEFNFIGNKSELISVNSFNHIDISDEKNTHDDWNPEQNDISYYLLTKPGFLAGYKWPPIGPQLNSEEDFNTHDIPARDRFCAANPTMCDDY